MGARENINALAKRIRPEANLGCAGAATFDDRRNSEQSRNRYYSPDGLHGPIAVAPLRSMAAIRAA
jgi:hypothetical protein